MSSGAPEAAPTIDLEAYAELSGRTWLRGDEILGQELARRGLQPDEWSRARAYWTRAIDDDIERGQSRLVRVFAARFDAARRQTAEDPAPASAPAPTEATAAPAVAPVAAVPSYLAGPGVAREPAPSSVPSTPPAFVPPRAIQQKLGGTALAVGAPSGPATPFAAAPKPVPRDGLMEYATLTAELAVDPHRAAEVLAKRNLSAAAKEALDAQWQARFSRHAMAALQYTRLVEQEQARLKELRGARQRAGAVAPVAPAVTASRAGSGTGIVPAEIVQSAALPFGGRAEPSRAPVAPELTLPRYASLCAELAVAPERRDETLRRYGVAGSDAHAELDRAWRDRLARDPAAATEFAQSVRSYRAWLLQNR